jgi:twitching motility protein PilT
MRSIEEILRTAKEAGASDVHMTVGIPPKMRVNGKLKTMPFDRMMPGDTLEVLLSIMSESQKERFEERGELDFSYSIPELGRYRVNAFKQRGTVALAFRLVSSEIPSPESLGVPESVIDLYQSKRGLVLVTGPTGSGKSTTLAAIIDKANHNRDAHIITLEDPLEFLHRHIKSIVSQREISTDTESYLTALRAALRQSPDVVLLGEMRDYETINTAVTAAETGHLIFSSLHTIGASNTIDRIIDAFPASQQQQICIQLASVLQAVVSQKLIPTIDGKVVPAFEIMVLTPAIRTLIRERKVHQIDGIIYTSANDNMISMDTYIYNLYLDGRITKETAISEAVNPEMMERRINIK